MHERGVQFGGEFRERPDRPGIHGERVDRMVLGRVHMRVGRAVDDDVGAERGEGGADVGGGGDVEIRARVRDYFMPGRQLGGHRVAELALRAEDDDEQFHSAA